MIIESCLCRHGEQMTSARGYQNVLWYVTLSHLEERTSHWSLIGFNSIIAVRDNILSCYSLLTLKMEIRQSDVETGLLSSSVSWPFCLTCCMKIKSFWLLWQLQHWQISFPSSKIQWLHTSVMMYCLSKLLNRTVLWLNEQNKDVCVTPVFNMEVKVL